MDVLQHDHAVPCTRGANGIGRSVFLGSFLTTGGVPLFGSARAGRSTKSTDFCRVAGGGSRHLLVVLVSLVVDDVKELELVDTLGGRDDAEPVAELHLLKELLGPIRPVLLVTSLTGILF